jgi:hypothetical protein
MLHVVLETFFITKVRHSVYFFTFVTGHCAQNFITLGGIGAFVKMKARNDGRDQCNKHVNLLFIVGHLVSVYFHH